MDYQLQITNPNPMANISQLLELSGIEWLSIKVQTICNRLQSISQIPVKSFECLDHRLNRYKHIRSINLQKPSIRRKPMEFSCSCLVWNRHELGLMTNSCLISGFFFNGWTWWVVRMKVKEKRISLSLWIGSHIYERINHDDDV